MLRVTEKELVHTNLQHPRPPHPHVPLWPQAHKIPPSQRSVYVAEADPVNEQPPDLETIDEEPTGDQQRDQDFGQDDDAQDAGSEDRQAMLGENWQRF